MLPRGGGLTYFTPNSELPKDVLYVEKDQESKVFLANRGGIATGPVQ